MKNFFRTIILTICLSIVFLPAVGSAADKNPWQFGASLYGWFPDIAGKTAFTQPGGSNEFEIGIENILNTLEFTLMGMFDARKGRWGLLTDVIYMNVGDSQSGMREGDITIGQNPLPVNATGDVKLDLDFGRLFSCT